MGRGEGRGCGLLSKGTPLKWSDSLKWQAHVRRHGIIQFINIWNNHRHRHADTFMWGDEVLQTPYHSYHYIATEIGPCDTQMADDAVIFGLCSIAILVSLLAHLCLSYLYACYYSITLYICV
jgi:hypothetical protein